MVAFSLFACLTLFALSALHAAWAARVWWPVGDEGQLARTVAGFPGVEKMPNALACALVAAALFVVALLLTIAVLDAEPPALVWPALVGASFVFLVRGAVGYTPYWHRATPEEPFRRLDRIFYSPLCLILGGAIAATAIGI
ncbi:MAG: DUF3995 domain-containing protein [Pseudomonadota bacterium]